MTTKRKPYVRPMTSTWWKKLPFYRFYMLREGTAVPAVCTEKWPGSLGGIRRLFTKPGYRDH